MASEVYKKYGFGFVLTEQDLRRIWNCCEQHFAKANQKTRHVKLDANLHDGSSVVTESIDDILALENGGAKRVSRLRLVIADTEKDSTTGIWVLFRDGLHGPPEWASVELFVHSADRDWAFLAADEIEDRLKRVKRLALGRLAQSPFVIPILMIGAMMAAIAFASGSPQMSHKLKEIESAMTNSTPLDPVKVIVQIEEARYSSAPLQMALFLCVFVALLVGGYLLIKIVPRVFQLYCFCWGEQLAASEKRQSRAKVFWIAGVLGVLASIIAGLILKYLRF